MYNSFLANKNAKCQLSSTIKQRKLSEWNKRYKTEIRPVLINNFDRRINGFAKKMEDEPVVVKNVKEGTNDDILMRNFDKTMNMSKHNFMFKNQQDWKSIFTPGERAERQQALRTNHNSSDKLAVLRSLWSQSKYSSKQIEFRPRDKEKDVNPPMKYTNKTPAFILTSLPKIRNKYRNRRSKTQVTTKNSHAEERMNTEQDNNNDQMSQNLSGTEQDLLGNAHFWSNSKKNAEANVKSQYEIMQQEQMKKLAHKRLYFKSLINLQQNVHTAKQRNQLKDVLIKCGIFKPIRGKIYEEQEIDRFLQLMKTKNS